MGSIDYTENKERTFTGMDREAGTMGNAGAVCGGGGPVNERDAERIWREVSLESLFCLLSNQTDHRKNTGGGYRNAFCFIETVGLLENGCGGEGETVGDYSNA